jgi:hypothetical protein
MNIKLIRNAVITSLLLTVSSSTSRAELFETNSIQQSDSSTTAFGCVVSLLKSLNRAIPGLYFKSSCLQEPGTDRYVWEFLYKNVLFSDDSETSLEFCASALGTALNFNIPVIDISINYRCQRNEGTPTDPIYFWKYNLKYDLNHPNY